VTKHKLMAFVTLCGALTAVTIALVYEPSIDPVDVSAVGFDAALVQKGADLATIGDCITCHTSPGGKSFAGGLPLKTPFGTIYSTNISPDPETGIGHWSEAAFRRAMRRGVAPDGKHLYPAFPYDHFTLVSDDDDKALYAYLMTRQPIHALSRTNELSFPFNVRFLLAGWKMLFLGSGPFKPDPAADPIWSRGAYLVLGIGHCGACHTPRNILGAEKAQPFSGGEAEGWQAFPINSASLSPVPWTEESLKVYLRRGWHELHGVAAGPMAPVAENLSVASEDDVRAIAVYVASGMGRPFDGIESGGRTGATRPSGNGSKPQSGGSQTVPGAPDGDIGARIYASTCATCHESGRAMPYGGIDLSLSTLLSAPSSRNFMRLLLDGLPATDGRKAPIMPEFSAILTDEQAIAIASYVRSHFGNKPPWQDVSVRLREARDDQAAAPLSSAADHRPAANK